MLTPGEVHFWLGEIGPSVDLRLKADLLSPTEQRRAAAFVTKALRARYTASVVLLRSVLGRYLECDPKVIQFKVGPHGKPYLNGSAFLQFNVSHAHERALVALTLQREIGVDIEYSQRPLADLDALAQRFFAPAEYHALMQVQVEDRLLAFYRLWTRKEAFIKATGQGLFFGLDKFTVSLQERGMDCLLSVEGRAQPASSWTLGSISPMEQGYTAAFAIKGAVTRHRLWHWEP